MTMEICIVVFLVDQCITMITMKSAGMTSSRDDKGFHGYNACSPTNVPRSQDLSPPSLCYHFGREQGNDTYFSMIVTALKMKI